ncbi:MAG: penicillin-insensitive murein endopeptidase [Hyphomicrobiales bacterium]|nr:MAG: penicillin-insensitive murein endopeptidase [Hyphomicrobiales bacterium]
MPCMIQLCPFSAMRLIIVPAVFLAASLCFGAAIAASPTAPGPEPAKKLFGKAHKPAKLKPASFGTYNRGCLAGAEHLSADGPAWQSMRLKRNRQWAHPVMIEYLKKLAIDVQAAGFWRGLLVGDLSQPRGGPMLTGHASHQIGLDADIWLMEMPKKRLSKKRRNSISAVSVIRDRAHINPKIWSVKHAKLLKQAASYDQVERIFVHPAIKKALCDWSEGQKRDWLRHIRPWYGHHYHFHVRMKCPKSMKFCRNQPPPPPGDGCDSERLSWWLSDKPYRKAKPSKTKPKKKYKPKPPITLADLPEQCAEVIEAK